MSWDEALEKHGFSKSIAGKADFNAAVKACEIMAASPNLGLIVSGKYGVGKTKLLNAIKSLMADKPAWINLGDPNDLECLTDEWMDYHCANFYKRNVILDDLGAEKPVNEYGVRSEIVADFIIRYHLQGKGRIIISTNLNTVGIDDRYGGRFLSRLKDLCVPLRFTGNDKRNWSIG